MESGVTIKIKLKLPNVETAASFEKPWNSSVWLVILFLNISLIIL